MKTAPKVIKMSECNYSDELFKTLQTNTALDGIFSTEGGIYPATNYIVLGDGGVGKSTVLLDILAHLKSYKTLFISAEMNAIDMYGYVKRNPAFGEINTLFFSEIECDDEDVLDQLDEVLNEGYDLILIDSFSEVQEVIQENRKISSRSAESLLIDLMRKHNLAENNLQKNTAFICIQQVGKGGNFLGSNKLKHNTTGMIAIRHDISGDRKIQVIKNRRGMQYSELFFRFNSAGKIQYNMEKLDLQLRSQKLQENKIELDKEFNEEFDRIFSSFSNTNA